MPSREASPGTGSEQAGTVCAQALVYGGVQGVSFRYYTRQRARELGLAGWVCNRPDGSVEVRAQGDPSSVERLMEWLYRGPSAARVERVETADCPRDPGLDGFEIR